MVKVMREVDAVGLFKSVSVPSLKSDVPTFEDPQIQQFTKNTASTITHPYPPSGGTSSGCTGGSTISGSSMKVTDLRRDSDEPSKDGSEGVGRKEDRKFKLLSLFASLFSSDMLRGPSESETRGVDSEVVPGTTSSARPIILTLGAFPRPQSQLGFSTEILLNHNSLPNPFPPSTVFAILNNSPSTAALSILNPPSLLGHYRALRNPTFRSKARPNARSAVA